MGIISNIIKSEKNRKILLKATDDVIDEVVKIQGTKEDIQIRIKRSGNLFTKRARHTMRLQRCGEQTQEQ